MIESVFHSSDNGNLYIYDDQRRLSLLIHPEFRKAHEKSTDVDSYYMKKYDYLKEYGFFAQPQPIHFEAVDESMIKESIIQTSKIMFEVTDSCNLNCMYCGYGELYEGFDARNRKNINIRSAKKLLKYIFDLKPKNKNTKLFVGFYGGEPLLNMNFIKTVVETTSQMNSEKELDIEYTITTNATLIHKYIHFLVAHKFRLSISLDGNKENHSYRVFSKNKKNSFRIVVENIDMIQRDYPEYFANHVSFSTVLHNRNSVKDIYEFIYTRYHKIPLITELALRDVKPDKKELVERMFHNMRNSEDEYQQEESNLLPATHNSDSYHELTYFMQHFSINFYVSNITDLLGVKEKYFPTSTCLPFSRKIFLTNRGKLLPCEMISNKYSMGKVDKNVMIDIPEITRRYNCYYDRLKNVCQYCYAYRFCGLCMFYINNLDKLETEEFVCDRFYDQKAFQNKLYRTFSFLEKKQIDISHILDLENIKTE